MKTWGVALLVMLFVAAGWAGVARRARGALGANSTMRRLGAVTTCGSAEVEPPAGPPCGRDLLDLERTRARAAGPSIASRTGEGVSVCRLLLVVRPARVNADTNPAELSGAKAERSRPSEGVGGGCSGGSSWLLGFSWDSVAAANAERGCYSAALTDGARPY